MKGTRHDELLGRLRELAAAVASTQGLELVELSLHGSSTQRTLRVDIDRAGPLGVGLEDCQRVSVLLGEALDAEDPLESRYVLQVSSPGLDRPIRSAADFRRNTGRRIVVKPREPVRGKNELRGTLLGIVEGAVRVEDDELGTVDLSPEKIESTRQDPGF